MSAFDSYRDKEPDYTGTFLESAFADPIESQASFSAELLLTEKSALASLSTSLLTKLKQEITTELQERDMEKEAPAGVMF